MTRAALHLVAKPPIPMPFDDAKAKKIIEAQRDKLLSAAVRYVKDGKDGSRNDRLRTASDISGIPITLLEVEVLAQVRG